MTDALDPSDLPVRERVSWTACPLPRQFEKIQSTVIDPVTKVEVNQFFVDHNGEMLFTPGALQFKNASRRFSYIIETFEKCAMTPDFSPGFTCKTVINDSSFISKLISFARERQMFDFPGTDYEFLVYISTGITLVAGRSTRRTPTRFQTVIKIGDHDPEFDPFGPRSHQYKTLSEFIK